MRKLLAALGMVVVCGGLISVFGWERAECIGGIIGAEAAFLGILYVYSQSERDFFRLFFNTEHHPASFTQEPHTSSRN